MAIILYVRQIISKSLNCSSQFVLSYFVFVPSLHRHHYGVIVCVWGNKLILYLTPCFAYLTYISIHQTFIFLSFLCLSIFYAYSKWAPVFSWTIFTESSSSTPHNASHFAGTNTLLTDELISHFIILVIVALPCASVAEHRASTLEKTVSAVGVKIQPLFFSTIWKHSYVKKMLLMESTHIFVRANSPDKGKRICGIQILYLLNIQSSWSIIFPLMCLHLVKEYAQRL